MAVEKNRFSGLIGELNSDNNSGKDKQPEQRKGLAKAKPKYKDPNYKQIGLYLPTELHKRMKIGSAVTGLEMSAIAQAGIEMWLAANVPEK